ncbi:MAG: hypothetical protein UZ19_OD1000576 [Parcubacteria bacterium OLB19]|nr:MAG: hypothetical protein UZ19_OD1000576 [Parcubacteria bacterium OLB19]
MIYGLDSKIVGAFLVGLVVVAVSYKASSAEREVTNLNNEDSSIVVVDEAPARTAIEVKDSDNDGIEDWQDQFLTAEPIIIDKNQGEYTPPDTVTGQMSINLMQNFLSTKINGFGPSQEKIVADTVNNLKKEAEYKIYSLRDITISDDSSDEAVRDYGNAMANAILDNATTEKTRSDIEILTDIANKNEVTEEDIKDLEIIARVYKDTLEDTLIIPVPKEFSKEHLDLINVYNALYYDIEGITKIMNDPVVTLLRIKRYKDDMDGLSIALQNMYMVLDKHPYQFSVDDTASLFANFAPNLNRP